MDKRNSDRETLQEIFDQINEWIDKSLDHETPVIDYHPPHELKKRLNLDLSENGTGSTGLKKEVASYLRHAVKTSNPAYLNQLFGGFGFPGFVGELLAAATNTSMYTYEVAPVATLIENAVIEKMISYTGWKSGTGTFTTGGSNSNMLAMLLARNNHFKNLKQEGLSGHPKMAVFVSERSHFSMLKGANTIGIGQNGVIKVPVDENGRMRGSQLEKAILDAKVSGFEPFMICSTAGTTETGSFDAIDEASALAEKYNLWHHVDGSWCGSLLLSEKYHHLFKGLESADSFAWNPHKLMSVPLVAAAFMVRDEGVMKKEIQTNDADYIYHDHDLMDYDKGPASLQCGRRVDVLKVWLSWKYYGNEGYRNRIEKCMELASYATSIVDTSDELELMFPTQTLNVNFRFKVPSGVDADAFNKEIRYKLIENGKAMVNYCPLKNGLSIRLVLLNPDLNKNDIDRFFERFLLQGRELLKLKLQQVGNR